MADLTPEMLAQLERTALHFTAAGCFDDDIQVAEALASIPALVAAAKERDQLRVDLQGQLDHGSKIVAPHIESLRAERDRLRAEVATHDEQIAAIMDGTFAVGDGTAQKEIERLRAEVADNKSEIKQLSETLSDSQVDRSYLSERIDKLSEDAIQLRAEVDRLRGLGLEALEKADEARGDVEDQTMYGLNFAARIEEIRAQIERKP